jgi:hypothetical protein
MPFAAPSFPVFKGGPKYAAVGSADRLGIYGRGRFLHFTNPAAETGMI